MLPDRPAAYDGVNVLVLSGVAPSAVTQRALKAIAMSVALGGTLVVPTGPDYKRFQNDFYNDLLPVKITGAANLPGLSPTPALGGKPFSPGPVAVSKGVVKPGVGGVIHDQSGIPIVAECRYGAGRVIYLALDYQSPPFKELSQSLNGGD